MRFTLGMLAGGMLVCGCAGTSGGTRNLPPPIPEGKGRLILDAGGIPQLNFYIIDQELEEIIYEDTPRVASRFPTAFENGGVNYNLSVDLDPGLYTIVVNTDISDNWEVEDVAVKMGEDRYVPIRVGRFQVLVPEGEELPFLIMDYTLSNVLGRGLTSPEIKHFIVPEGVYKIRMENSPTGFDEIKQVEVYYGRVTSVTIAGNATQQDQGTTGGTTR